MVDYLLTPEPRERPRELAYAPHHIPAPVFARSRGATTVTSLRLRGPSLARAVRETGGLEKWKEMISMNALNHRYEFVRAALAGHPGTA